MTFDAAPCGLMRTSDDGTFLRVNRTFAAWVGRAPEALVGQQRFQDLLTMGGRMFHQTHWAPLLRMQGSVSEVKLELRHADGSVIPMVLNAIRREDEGVYVHDLAAFVARDRDRFEQELVRSRRRLEELVAVANQLEARAKDRALLAEQMIGIVSHDLRNPLSTIAMAASVMAGGEATPHLRHVQRIGRAVDQAQSLIADLLDFTQARLGNGLRVTRASVDLHAVVGEHVEDLQQRYPASMLAHVRHGAGACTADVDRLAQLLGNLVSNAVAYGDRAAPITITSTVGEGSAALAVHNHGAPIAPALQATLFEPMTRGTDVGSKGRSVGLGLFIVREIARAHGGSVAVRSTPADGTTFEVSWPCP